MEIRMIKLEDLDSVFKLLDELYENKIEYSKFTQKYKDSLKDNSFYGIVAIDENNGFEKRQYKFKKRLN